MTDKILTSEELFERLRTIIPNIDEWGEIISLDIQLRSCMFAVMHITRYATEADHRSKVTFRSDGNTFEDSLAVYNVNDFEDVMNKNNLMEDMLRRICASHWNGAIDNLDELMTEAKVILGDK